MTTVHHRGSTWERNTKSYQQIDAELRDLADSTVERIAAQLDTASMGSLRYEDWHPDQQRAMRAQNELARRRTEAECAKPRSEKPLKRAQRGKRESLAQPEKV